MSKIILLKALYDTLIVLSIVLIIVAMLTFQIITTILASGILIASLARRKALC